MEELFSSNKQEADKGVLRNNQETVCVVDADSLLYTVCYKNKDEDNFKVHKDWLDRMLYGIFKNTGSSKYVICLSAKTTHKKSRFPTYKAKRKKIYLKFYNDLFQYLVENYSAAIIEGFEADDLLGIFSKSLAKTYDVILAYIDKDLAQIPGKYYNYKTKELGVVSTEEARIFFLKQLIIGDATDNIEGIKGRGVVYADSVVNKATTLADIFAEYLKKYPEIEAVENFYQNYTLLKIDNEYEWPMELLQQYVVPVKDYEFGGKIEEYE